MLYHPILESVYNFKNMLMSQSILNSINYSDINDAEEIVREITFIKTHQARF